MSAMKNYMLLILNIIIFPAIACCGRHVIPLICDGYPVKRDSKWLSHSEGCEHGV